MERHKEDTGLRFEGEKLRSYEAFRAMAKSWDAMKKPTLQAEPNALDLAISQTYCAIKQEKTMRMKELSQQMTECAPKEEPIAKPGKHSYYNSNSKPNSKPNSKTNSKPNSNTFSLKHSSATDWCLLPPEEGWEEEKERKEFFVNDFAKKDLSLDDLLSMLRDRLGIPCNDMLRVELGGYYGRLGWELCLFAIERAESCDSPTWLSVRGILKRLASRGIKTREEAETFEENRREELERTFIKPVSS